MERVKPLIQRYISSAIIAVEITMMELMKKVSSSKDRFTPNPNTLESTMPGDCTQCWKIHVEKNMNWMWRDNKMNKHATEIERMLDGMHRYSSPGSDIDISMVHCVSQFI